MNAMLKRRRFYPIIIVTFFLLNTSMMIPISQTATADTEHWVDWVIDEDITVTGEKHNSIRRCDSGKREFSNIR